MTPRYALMASDTVLLVDMHSGHLLFFVFAKEALASYCLYDFLIGSGEIDVVASSVCMLTSLRQRIPSFFFSIGFFWFAVTHLAS